MNKFVSEAIESITPEYIAMIGDLSAALNCVGAKYPHAMRQLMGAMLGCAVESLLESGDSDKQVIALVKKVCEAVLSQTSDDKQYIKSLLFPSENGSVRN